MINDRTQLQKDLTPLMKKAGHNMNAYYGGKIVNPYLIIQFKEREFYLDANLTTHFTGGHLFHEPDLQRYTFLIDVEVVASFDSADMALYKAINIDRSVIAKIPSIEMDFSCYDSNSNVRLLFLQSSPNSPLGRMISEAKIEGISEHWSNLGGFIADGKRYICQNYFRFGSSGAPYITYDPASDKLYLNAIQSEAAPLQLLINNSREGNQQYTHAIASPLYNIKDELQNILDKALLDEVTDLK